MRAQPFLTAPPPVPPSATRGYDKLYDWIYGPVQFGAGPGNLVPVYLDDVPLNTGDMDTGLSTVIEDVTGWLDSPPLDGHDVNRAVADGSGWGPKTLGARVVTLTGVAIGIRDLLLAFRDMMAAKAAARLPADLSITRQSDLDADPVTLTASVRGDSDAFKIVPLGRFAFRYQLALTAADPALYDATWQTEQLAPGGGAATGRLYQRGNPYPWAYGSPDIASDAYVANDGNWPTPVFLLYTGDLGAGSQVTDDDQSGQINLAALQPGEQVLVESDTLSAVAGGSLSRASYIQAGSRPLVIAPQTSTMWHLYATSQSGAGYVQLAWRSAWV